MRPWRRVEWLERAGAEREATETRATETEIKKVRKWGERVGRMNHSYYSLGVNSDICLCTCQLGLTNWTSSKFFAPSSSRTIANVRKKKVQGPCVWLKLLQSDSFISDPRVSRGKQSRSVKLIVWVINVEDTQHTRVSCYLQCVAGFEMVRAWEISTPSHLNLFDQCVQTKMISFQTSFLALFQNNHCPY